MKLPVTPTSADRSVRPTRADGAAPTFRKSGEKRGTPVNMHTNSHPSKSATGGAAGVIRHHQVKIKIPAPSTPLRAGSVSPKNGETRTGHPLAPTAADPSTFAQGRLTCPPYTINT